MSKATRAILNDALREDAYRDHDGTRDELYGIRRLLCAYFEYLVLTDKEKEQAAKPASPSPPPPLPPAPNGVPWKD